MQDAETGEQLFVDTSDRGFRQRFARIAAQREADLRGALAHAGVDALELSTDDDLVDAILRFADLRRQRSRAGAPAAACRATCTRRPERPTRTQGRDHDLPLAANAVAAAAAAAAGAAVPVAAAPAQDAGAALRQPGASCKRGAGHGPALRRHVPPVLFLLALAAMLLAVARPAAVVTLPSQQETIILAMDVSGSMRATDVKPNRLVAAQDAAKAFVAELPRNVRIGVVSFAGTASVVQPPTHSREDLVAAIDRFQLQRGTAIGSGIWCRWPTLFPDAGIDLAAVSPRQRPPRAPAPIDAAPKKPQKEFTPVAPGSYSSAAIILLTDGQRTTGAGPARGRQDGRRPRRARLHRGHRHHGRRDHRLRRLVDARAPRRGDAEDDRAA